MQSFVIQHNLSDSLKACRDTIVYTVHHIEKRQYTEMSIEAAIACTVTPCKTCLPSFLV